LRAALTPNLDILETIQTKLGQFRNKKPGEQIASWDYFTRAIAEAKAKRERGLPAVNLGNGAARYHSKAERPRRTSTTYVTEPDGNDDLLGGGR
jgi:hypothetical protein